MFSNIIAGAAGFPVADLGDNINQSLRFPSSTGPSLSRTMGTGDSRKKFTVSVWVKRGKIPSGDQNHIWNYHANPNVCALGFNGNKLRFYHYDSSGTFNAQYVSSAVFRDTSAWYHIVASVDTTLSSATDRVKLWVNGTRITSFDTQTTFSQNYDTHVGVNNYTALIGIYADGSSFKFGGYVANKYFLDGITASETDFGRYQEDGVWVPKNYTGTYGTNGYRLNFANSSDLGNDVSGNNNDFTASGFDTADVNAYITQLTATVGGFPVGKANAFDGDINTRAYGDGNGTWQFAPDPAIPFDSLRIYSVGGSTTTFNWDGNSTVANTSSGGWRSLNTGGSGGSISTSKPLTIVGSGGGRPELNALEVTVGGVATIITSATDNDVNYKDTPTNNHPTINKLYPVSNPPQNTGLKDGNLGYTGLSTQWSNGATTIKLPSTGEYYWEHEVVNLGDHQYFGVTKMPSIAGLNVTGFISFRAYNGINWYVYQDSSLLQTGTYQIATGDIIGQAYNVDTGVYRVWVNGTLAATNTWSLRPTDEDLFIYGSLEAKSSNEFRVNYGQRDFIYTPPTGALRLHTNNLPEPTIKKPKEHFDVLTWTGDGASPKTRTGLEFAPDLIWIKDRNNTFTIGHRLYDSVRGAGVNKHLDPSTYEQEGYGNDEDYGYVTGFVDGGFTTQTGTTGDDYVNDTSTNYVAWCWSAPETWSSTDSDITAGTIASSGRRNKDAGFSITSYQGNLQAGATVAHGLSTTPEFMIHKSRNLSSSGASPYWSCWHVGTGNSNSYLLDENWNAAFNAYNGGSPNANHFVLGPVDITNSSGKDFIAYCWHSIPGYSKFGSYNGGGSGSAPNYDGPFIHLGFRPAWLLIKRSDAGGDPWILLDSARDTHNFAFRALKPDTNDSEVSSGDQFAIDFLSNGFKCRSSNAAINNSSATYIYAAFAENPFGGENAAPVTAR